MCEPTTIAIGIAVGAATGAAGAAITGQDVGRGALMGGLMGGVTGGMGGLSGGTGGSLFSGIGQAMNLSTAGIGLGTNISFASLGGFAASSLAGSVLMGAMTPDTPEYYNYQQQLYTPNSQPSTVTGSGGKQAAFSLAESVRRAKKRKLTQEDVSDLSIDTSSFASEGLQFA